jgi:hypothetical protein
VTGRHVRPLHHGSSLMHFLGANRMIPDSRALVKCLSGPIWDFYLYQPFADTEFGIQNGAACGSTDGVVAKQHEFVTQDGATT